MKQLLFFESYIAYKQRSVLVLAMLAFVYGILINIQQIGEGMNLIALNSPYRISYFLTLTSICLPFTAALFSINTLLKDREYKFEGITATLSSNKVLLSRWLVILSFMLMLSLLLMVGMAFSLMINSGDPSSQLPLNVFDFLWPWLLVVVPNTLLVTSILIAVTTFWKSAKVSYALSVVLVMFAWLALIIINAPITGESALSISGWTKVLAILDPFASSSFFEQTQFWTPAEKNQLTIQLDGYMLINRLWVIALAISIFGWLWHSVTTTPNYLSLILPVKPVVKDDKQIVVKTSKVICEPSFQHFWINSFTQQVRFYCEQLLANWPVRILLIIWWCMSIIGILMVAGVFNSGEFSGKYTTSAELIGQAGEAFNIFSLVILVFVIAEVLWIERDHKVSGLLMTTPLSSTASYVAKLTSVLLLPIIMLVLMLGSCLVYQQFFTDSNIELSLYALTSYYSLTPIIYQTILLFLVQSFVANASSANKYLAMLVSALILVFISQFLASMGVHSPLAQLNQFPNLTRGYSAIAGFAGKEMLFNYLALYWGMFAIFAALLSQRWWLTRDRLSSVSIITFKGGIVSFSVFILIGVWLAVQMPIYAHQNSEKHLLAAKADYEKNYQIFANMPHPEFSQTDMTVDIYPNKERIHIASINKITNYFDRAIEQVLISSKQPLNKITIEGAVLQKQQTSILGEVYVFELTQPMQPNEHRELSYTLTMQSQPFAINPGIVDNGVYLHQGNFEPLLGYAPMLEISDNFTREQYNLQPKAEKHQHDLRLMTKKRKLSATLSTVHTQTAFTSGKLLKHWRQGKRTYFQYQIDKPIYPIVGYFSAEYQAHHFDASGTPVTLYFHPQHQRNIEEIAHATQFTLAYMRQHFGDYPYSSLRLIEVPIYHPFGGKASAGIVALNERLFLQDYQDNAAINNVARNTIHEVAHQWFGEKLVPKITKGEKVLTESITKSIEADVLGLMYGEKMKQSLMAFNLRRYQSGRAFANDDEPSLLDAQGQAYLTYGKGPVVFQQLKQHLGEEQYHQVLKAFIIEHQHDMKATLTELVKRFAKKSASPEYVEALFSTPGLTD
ncbi:M1 family aminopeptidase [Thalassotalea hakodatensis]|uniref:M1 family aminopeptidase n=1 Tax=Thalassotalea hakodatensis TaxID=3030492 RepID=UPI00257307B2|nr:M1 family aminopeptidase [Thalassotalea hakodatensis]